uniref:AKTx n=1 Tax=Hadrurus spadix TaxID=141984 RepID=A0A1W7RB23_9SCOR
MNTKLVLIMLMITSVILVFEAETVSSTSCINPKQCTELCRAKGCKHGKCMNRKCHCMLCSK